MKTQSTNNKPLTTQPNLRETPTKQQFEFRHTFHTNSIYLYIYKYLI